MVLLIILKFVSFLNFNVSQCRTRNGTAVFFVQRINYALAPPTNKAMSKVNEKKFKLFNFTSIESF